MVGTLVETDLSRLGPESFERLFQALLKRTIGPGTTTFGAGKDGAREATFSGLAEYPSPAQQWGGEWVFQAKFHNLSLVGAEKARAAVMAEIESELTRLTQTYGTACENYILGTNVPLTGVHKTGNRDRITREILPKFPKVKNIHVWDANEIAALLRQNRDVARSFAHLLTPGDLISELLDSQEREKSELATTVRLFLAEGFKRDRYAALEQAGEVAEDKLQLERIFIDLGIHRLSHAEIRQSNVTPSVKEYLTANLLRGSGRRRENPSLLNLLSEQMIPKIMILCGPGEGKSTIGQHLAQLHRSLLLQHFDQPHSSALRPELARIVIRVVLKDFAQMVHESTEQGRETSLEDYVTRQIADLSSRAISNVQLHQLMSQNPFLLILDGLDEVTEKRTRSTVIDLVQSFLDKAAQLSCDIQVVGTSRPHSYSDEFDRHEYVHVRLSRLEPASVREYVARWIEAKITDPSKATRLRSEIENCLEDPELRLLTTTPLQVTILILIILSGGTPPRQKEALFAEYLEVIYKREKAKSKQMLLTEKQVLFNLHQLVGYYIHRDSTAGDTASSNLSQPVYEEVVRAFLHRSDKFSPKSEIDARADQIVIDAGERFVLIVETTSGNWGFELRSIQEFFAAAHLNDSSANSVQRFDRLTFFANSAHWRNVALFFAGRIGRTNQGEALGVVQVCREVEHLSPNHLLHGGRWFALELAAERALGPNRSLQNSLIEYGLGVLESRYQYDSERVKTLIGRLPPEDVRDHVKPYLEQRKPAIRPRLMLDYLTFAIPRVAWDSRMDNLTIDASLEVDPRLALRQLRELVPRLEMSNAAIIWSDVYRRDPATALDLVGMWSSSGMNWVSRLLHECSAGPDALDRAIQWSQESVDEQLELVDPESVKSVVLQMPLWGLTPTDGDERTQALPGERAPTEIDEIVREGRVDDFRSWAGMFATTRSIAQFWRAHFRFGAPTTESTTAFCGQNEEIVSAYLEILLLDQQNVTPDAALVVGIVASRQRSGSNIAYHLASLFEENSAHAWPALSARLEDRLRELIGKEPTTILNLGGTTLTMREKAEADQLIQEVAGLSPADIWSAYCLPPTPTPLLPDLVGAQVDRWAGEVVQLLPGILELGGAARFYISQVTLIGSLVPAEDTGRLQPLIDLLSTRNHYAHERGAFIDLLMAYTKSPDEKFDENNLRRWLREATFGDHSNWSTTRRSGFSDLRFRRLLAIIHSAIESSDIAAARGAAYLFHSMALRTPYSSIRPLLRSYAAKDTGFAIQNVSLGNQDEWLRVVWDWINSASFFDQSDGDLAVVLSSVASDTEVSIWHSVLNEIIESNETDLIEQIKEGLINFLEGQSEAGYTPAVIGMLGLLNKLVSNLRQDVSEFESQLDLPFQRERIVF